MRVGIVGLPNVGKSTLFNAVTSAGAEQANYPFTTIEPNVGVVPLRDPRLEEVARLAGSPRVVHASVQLVDIAGLVRGASKGEGLGNQFLSHIRDVDAVCHVVRCFDDGEVVHVDGSIDPVRDIDVVRTELLLKDAETLHRAHDRAARAARTGDRDAVARAALLDDLAAHVDAGEPARTFAGAGEAAGVFRELGLLTAKPVLYAANIDEADLPDGDPVHLDPVRELARREAAEVVVLAAETEAELTELDEADRAEYLAELGLEASGLDRLVHASYRLLGLRTFFTANENEARAWTVRAGATAPEAAGVVHSDMQRGFIRAEVIHSDDYIALGGEAGAREVGKLRVEGKDYVVRDGEVLQIRFSV